ncbi:MAG: hypothetical protein ACI4F4_04150 [Lachnospiraceae bacterium]
MDENYLDNLLNEFSLDKEIDDKIEDELDEQIAKDKLNHKKANSPSRDELFNQDLEEDASGEMFDQDLSFSEEQMDELDALDDFADLDIGDLDFADIDFDDLDVTKLDDVDSDDLDDLLKSFEGDFGIDDSLFESKDYAFDDEGKVNADVKTHVEPTNDLPPEAQSETSLQEDLNEDSFDADEFLNHLMEDADESKADETPIVELEEGVLQSDSNEQDSMEALSDGDLDELLNSLSGETSYDALDTMEGFSDFGKVEEEQSNDGEQSDAASDDGEEGNLDDLFSLLDLDESEQEEVKQAKEQQSGFSKELEELEKLDDLEDTSAKAKNKKKKKNLIDILFGEDEEELSDEQIEQIKAQKEEKKAQKKAKKQADKENKKEKSEAAKAEKEQKLLQKKKEDALKQKVKAEKKAKRKAQELENAEPEKKLNSAMVIFVFSLFLGGTFISYLAANNFNYTLAIQKATDYFESQKYHKAYDEIKGVDVKEKDQDLKDRIYTVMYVERLFESYENNIELGFYDKALDSLLRGVDKYYEHYDEAVELGIVSDIDYSFSQIKDTLMNQFGISVEQAVDINQLDDDEYVLTIHSYIEKNQDRLINQKPDDKQADGSSSIQNEDAMLGEQQEASEE